MARRLVFMGSDSIALPALDWLWTDGRSFAELVAVYTQPDRPHGRGQKVAPNAIKAWALERGLPVHQPEKLTLEARESFAALAPDAALVMAYGHILRQDWIDAPAFSIWNLHASLLPRYRGASPIQGAIANGERASGVCLMRIVRALDAGPVLDREGVPIDARDTAADLEAKLAAGCVPLLARSLSRAFAPEPAVIEQDHAQATFTRRLRKEDGRLDFHAPAEVLARRINALFPWPGAFFPLEGETIRAGLAEVAPADAFPFAISHAAAPGTILAADAAGLAIAAGAGGAVRLLRLQKPCGKMLAAGDFLRGHAARPGTILESAAMPELVAVQPFKG
ncbi:MAG: methionyl-tRNA formyltransferase [Opitutaceae bacterium]